MTVRPAMARRLQEARQAAEEAQQAFEDVVVEAWRNGGGLREIANEVGMSQSGISKMLERLGVRKRWRTLEDANRELERRERLDREG